MSLATDFRLAIQKMVQEATGIEVLAGKLEPRAPRAEGSLGCCWPVEQEERAANVTEQELEVRVRLFLPAIIDPASLPDPTPLEDLAQRVAERLDDDQDAGGVWFFRLTKVVYSMEIYAVELHVRALAENAFNAGA